jgi:hypothetical protein
MHRRAKFTVFQSSNAVNLALLQLIEGGYCSHYEVITEYKRHSIRLLNPTHTDQTKHLYRETRMSTKVEINLKVVLLYFTIILFDWSGSALASGPVSVLF